MRNALRSVARTVYRAWRMRGALRDYVAYAKHRLVFADARRRGMALRGVSPVDYGASRRMRQYDSALIPNRYVASVDAAATDGAGAIAKTGLTMGYPAWNLLYYSALCSLSPGLTDAVIL